MGADAGVLVSVAADQRLTRLEALALVGRVDDESRESRKRTLYAAPLVAGSGLALGGMATWNEDAWVRRLVCGGVGNEQMSGDEIVWPALEDYLLDFVAIALNHAGRAGVERRPFWQAPERGEALLAQLRLTGANGLGGLKTVPGIVSGAVSLNDARENCVIRLRRE